MWWLAIWLTAGLALALTLGHLAGRRRGRAAEPQWCGRPQGHDGQHAPSPLPGDR